MKQQILVIHGGGAFKTHEEYLEDLRTKEISLDKIRSGGWKENLEKVLGEEYDVLLPKMPNAQNARYAEWKIWFERMVPLLEENIIFIGHSLGGIFLAKYLSENDYLKKIKATFLVSAPFATQEENLLVDFGLADNFEKLEKQGGKIFLYHSKDDQVVPFSDWEKYKKQLPEAKTRTFGDRGHFNQNEFLEIVEDIKSLNK